MSARTINPAPVASRFLPNVSTAAALAEAERIAEATTLPKLLKAGQEQGKAELICHTRARIVELLKGLHVRAEAEAIFRPAVAAFRALYSRYTAADCPGGFGPDFDALAETLGVEGISSFPIAPQPYRPADGSPAPAPLPPPEGFAAVDVAAMLTTARRELALRQSVYPGQVKREKMTQEKADHETAQMAAIVSFLKHFAPDGR